MAKKEHPQAKWLLALADGKTIQRLNQEGDWADMSAAEVLRDAVEDLLETAYIRIKSEITITIGKYEVPEPMRVAPENGTDYYFITARHADGVALGIWDDGNYDNTVLSNGMCWLKREDAELAAKAITELLRGET